MSFSTWWLALSRQLSSRALNCPRV